MPCAGPSDAELRQMEAHENYQKFGKRWYDHELVENVACAYTNFVRNGVPLPLWAVKWSDDHIKKDLARKQAEKNAREAAEEQDFKLFQKLAKKYGRKVR